MSSSRHAPLDQDEAALAERLLRISTETPPPALDAAIRAHAHAALRTRPLQRWGAALAAVLALGVGVRVSLAPETQPAALITPDEVTPAEVAPTLAQPPASAATSATEDLRPAEAPAIAPPAITPPVITAPTPRAGQQPEQETGSTAKPATPPASTPSQPAPPPAPAAVRQLPTPVAAAPTLNDVPQAFPATPALPPDQQAAEQVVRSAPAETPQRDRAAHPAESKSAAATFDDPAPATADAYAAEESEAAMAPAAPAAELKARLASPFGSAASGASMAQEAHLSPSRSNDSIPGLATLIERVREAAAIEDRNAIAAAFALIDQHYPEAELPPDIEALR